MSRLSTVNIHVAINKGNDKSTCYIEDEGYFCDRTEALNRAVGCRTCPADTVKKWEDTNTCLDSTP